MNRAKGPWFIDKGQHHLRIRSMSSLKHEHSIALLPVGQKENALLIAAAPDLLEALKFALPLLKAYDSGDWAEAVLRAQKAIAKAAGGVE